MNQVVCAGWLLATVALTACQTTAGAQDAGPIEKPEVIVCDATPGDLDYFLSHMHRAGFREDPEGGYRSYRRDATRTLDALTLNPRFLRVTFNSYYTSDGTRIVADLEFVDVTRIRPVRDPDIIRNFQTLLEGFRANFPCD